MTEKEFIQCELYKKLVERNRPFSTKKDKNAFCADFYDYLRGINRFSNNYSRKVTLKFLCLLNEVPFKPSFIKTTKDFVKYKKLRRIYSNFQPERNRKVGTNKIDEIDWKFSLMKLWKEKPHRLTKTNSQLSSEERKEEFNLAKEHGYPYNLNSFLLRRKDIIRGIKECKNAQCKSQQELFQELKLLIQEPTQKTKEEVDEDRVGEEEKDELLGDIRNEAKEANENEAAEGMEGVRRRSARIKNMPLRHKNVGKRDSVTEKGTSEKTQIQEAVLYRPRLVSGYVDNENQFVGYKSTEIQERPIQLIESLLQKWEHRHEAVPNEGCYKKIYEKFGNMINKKMTFGHKTYEIDIPIGYGGFSVVHKGMSSHHGPVALKFAIKEEVEDLSDKLKVKNNPFIVNIIESYVIEGGFLYIMPLLDCDLYQLAFESGREVQLSHLQILQLAAQISSALTEIDSLNFFHADVKPENILLKEVEVKYVDGKRTLSRVHAMLVDYNICISKGKNDEPVHRIIQSCNYRAPEVIAQAPSTSKVDSWALSIVLLQLLFERAFIYKSYNGAKEAANYLLNINNEIFNIEPEDIKFGNKEIVRRYAELKAQNTYVGITLPERFASLPSTAVVSILKRVIRNCMAINFENRASIAETYEYIKDFV